MGREISAAAVCSQTFGKPSLGTRGYSADAVDRYLHVIAPSSETTAANTGPPQARPGQTRASECQVGAANTTMLSE
jgi:DivIVA domain-containing protein